MSYAGFLIRHDLFWSLLTGCGLGGVIAAVTLLPSRSPHPDRTRSRRTTVALLCAAFADASVAGGLLFVGFGQFVFPGWLVVGIVALVLSAVGGRFPRSAGVPILLVVTTLAVMLALSLQSWTPVRADTRIATFRVLSVSETRSRIEMEHPTNPSLPAQVYEISSNQAVASVHFLTLSRYLFLAGSEHFVFVGEDPSRVLIAEGAAGGPTPTPPLLSSDRLSSARSVTSSPTSLGLLRSYRIMIDTSGDPRIVDSRLPE